MLMSKLKPGLNLPGLPGISLGIEITEKDMEVLLFELKWIRESEQSGHVSKNEKPVLSKKEFKLEQIRYMHGIIQKVFD
jgi:hypothetical protein